MTENSEPSLVRIQHPSNDQGARFPLFFDSPHSGVNYPADYNYILPLIKLRQAEDTFIEDLYGDAPRLGATLIDARFPRSYIDVNRNELDFSPDDLDGRWPVTLKPGPKGDIGTGLVWVRLHGLTDIYATQLAPSQLQHRIDTSWKPYHQAVSKTFEQLVEKFKMAYHINCHSMPAMGTIKSPDGPIARADFVLGDRDGTTCEPGFTQAVKEFLEGNGFSVEINFPYKGVELVRRYSNPSSGRHSLQIEINRRLYMDEETLEKSLDYGAFKTCITGLVQALADYTKTKIKQA